MQTFFEANKLIDYITELQCCPTPTESNCRVPTDIRKTRMKYYLL